MCFLAFQNFKEDSSGSGKAPASHFNSSSKYAGSQSSYSSESATLDNNACGTASGNLNEAKYRVLEVVRNAGQTFDQAMRLFLESFRLPGEAQKINRIMESFGSHYHQQCPALFKNADAVYILAYSVILLNTDQHNSQACFVCITMDGRRDADAHLLADLAYLHPSSSRRVMPKNYPLSISGCGN